MIKSYNITNDAIICLFVTSQKSQLPSKSSLIKDKTGDILIIKGQIPLKKDSNLLIPPEDLFKKNCQKYIYI